MLYLYFFVASAVCILQALGSPDARRLASTLTQDYQAYVDPGLNPASILTVTVGYGIAGIDYDENTNVLSSQIWERYTWRDERLTWDPQDYGGISTIRLPAKMLWTPDIILYNSYDKPGDREEVNAVITSDGTVVWVPPAWYRTRCTPSVHRRTFNCTLQFGSWSYDGTLLELSLAENDLDLNVYAPHLVYDLTSTSLAVQTVVYDCCVEPYPSIKAQIGLERYGQGSLDG